MLNDIRDWLSLAIGTVSLVLTVTRATILTRRRRRRVRYRSFKCGRIEWTTYEREDDGQV